MSDRRQLRRQPARLAVARGFSMVELLVVLVLGLLLIVGVSSLFVSTRQTYSTNEGLARVQENARMSFELMAREVREAGAIPCGSRAVANVIRVSSAIPWWADWEAGPLRGYDDTEASAGIASFGTSAGDRVSGTDAILMLRVLSDESALKLVASHNSTTARITVNSVTGIAAGDVIAVCDQSSGAVTQVSGVNTASMILGHSTGGTFLNCSANLGYPTPGTCSSATAKPFASGGMVAKLDPAFWYVAYNGRGSKSLYRTRLQNSSGTISTVKEELIPGVENMQISYLTREAPSTMATTWIGASDATFSAANKGWTSENVKQVVAARIVLTMQTEGNVGADGKPLQRQYVAVASLRSRDMP